MVKLLNDVTSIETLELAVKAARKQLVLAEHALERFKVHPSQHVYATLDEAEATLEDLLREKASEACEGRYNMGDDEYTQEFSVDGKRYTATLECEYDRHDKTYYYLDRAHFSYEEVTDDA